MLSTLELRFSGNDQEILCASGNICHSETLDKESFSRVAKFYKVDGEILEAEEKMYASFRCVCGLGYMTVAEMLETMHENDLFDRFPLFSNVIPATLCSAERSFSALRRLKGHMQTLWSTMTWIVSLIFSAFKMPKTAINVSYELI